MVNKGLHSFHRIIFTVRSGISFMFFLCQTNTLYECFRLKSVFWGDVPNPKNCSWAQGVNFQKVRIKVLLHF